MKGRIFGFLIALFGLLFVGASLANASQTPSFPSCNNPSGSVIASYSDGTHGVPGDSTTYTGADNVYTVNGSQTLQCFCGGSQGVQTNWWKVGNLSRNAISSWEAQGWVYIPDGSAWGLESTGYLAYNTGYTCSNNNPNSGGAGGDGKSDGLGCGNHDCSGNKVGGGNSDNTNTGNGNSYGGFVEGIAGQILGSSTDTKTDSTDITKSICAACFWWPVLLGEVIALVGIYLLLKRGSLTGNKYLMGTIIGVAAYVAFLIVNKGHVCPDGGIGFWKFSMPCKYFWALDGVMVLLFSYLIRGVKLPVIKKSARK